jgi:hypothetical protein
MSKPVQIQFRAGPIEPHLAARASDAPGRSAVARRDLGRYYDALAIALASVTLTQAEALAICDSLNGTMLEPVEVRLMWAAVADARSAAWDDARSAAWDAEWGFDGAALVAKLRALPPFALLAIADAVERFWRDPGVPSGQRVREVGLVKE